MDRIRKNIETTAWKLKLVKEDLEEEYKKFRKSLQLLTKVLSENFPNLKAFTNSADVLDIGCRGGYLFDTMKEYGFQNFYGVDISMKSVDDLKERGYAGEIIDIQNDHLNKKFDLIILRHVLEHTAEPQKTINNCYKMLNKNGVLYVEVPKRTKGKDKDKSHFYQFDTLNRLTSLFDDNWKILYGQDDFPTISILKRL